MCRELVFTSESNALNFQSLSQNATFFSAVSKTAHGDSINMFTTVRTGKLTYENSFYGTTSVRYLLHSMTVWLSSPIDN